MKTRLSFKESIRNQESKKKWNLEELKEEKHGGTSIKK